MYKDNLYKDEKKYSNGYVDRLIFVSEIKNN